MVDGPAVRKNGGCEDSSRRLVLFLLQITIHNDYCAHSYTNNYSTDKYTWFLWLLGIHVEGDGGSSVLNHPIHNALVGYLPLIL